MGRLREYLTGHSLIGLDTAIFIYHLEAHPRYQPLAQELLAGVQTGRQTAIVSTIAGLTLRPWRVGRPSVAREYATLLVHSPQLVLADVTVPLLTTTPRLQIALGNWAYRGTH